MELCYFIITIFCSVILLEKKFYIALIFYLLLIVIYYYLGKKVKAYKLECNNIKLIIKDYYLITIGLKKELDFNEDLNSINDKTINEPEKIKLLDSKFNNNIFSLFSYIYFSEAMNSKKSKAIYEMLYFFGYLSKNHYELYLSILSESLKVDCYFILIMTLCKFLLNNLYDLVYTNIYLDALTIFVVVGYIIIDLVEIYKIKKSKIKTETHVDYLIMSFFVLINIDTPYNALIESIHLCEVNGINEFEGLKNDVENGNANSLYEKKDWNEKINYFILSFLKMTKANSYNQSYQNEKNLIVNKIINDEFKRSRKLILFKYILFGIYLIVLCYLIIRVY